MQSVGDSILVCFNAQGLTTKRSKFNRPHFWHDRGILYVWIFDSKLGIDVLLPGMPGERTDKFQLLKLEWKDRGDGLLDPEDLIRLSS
jgi:hypothetical protein